MRHKVKLSLTAIAFVLGIGAAFATKANDPEPDLCSIVEQNGTCTQTNEEVCCYNTVIGGSYKTGPFNPMQ
ncbi:DUF6520 family protein [Parapedobacter flavus]|uniref:DUF6520 family protein n=1 Tax=Parapedobacter flavus TaxID=3110225 RepID=UPI003F512AB4